MRSNRLLSCDTPHLLSCLDLPRAFGLGLIPLLALACCGEPAPSPPRRSPHTTPGVPIATAPSSAQAPRTPTGTGPAVPQAARPLVDDSTFVRAAADLLLLQTRFSADSARFAVARDSALAARGLVPDDLRAFARSRAEDPAAWAALWEEIARRLPPGTGAPLIPQRPPPHD